MNSGVSARVELKYLSTRRRRKRYAIPLVTRVKPEQGKLNLSLQNDRDVGLLLDS